MNLINVCSGLSTRIMMSVVLTNTGECAGFSVGVARRPDTIIVKAVPSRWFAETRVSSKPSMLVTHTIFSVLGKIRYILCIVFV